MPLTEETEGMELLISNYKETEDSSVLRPYEARMYYKNKRFIKKYFQERSFKFKKKK